MKITIALLSSLLISISVNGQNKMLNDLSAKITDISSSGTVAIVMTNLSKTKIRIWDDSNSWGAAHWRVLLLRKGKLTTFYQNPDQIFTVNVPRFREMAPGSHVDIKLDLNAGDWCGFGQCVAYNQQGFGAEKVRFEPGDIVIVIYDTPKQYEPETRNLGVWYGVVSALTTVQ